MNQLRFRAKDAAFILLGASLAYVSFSSALGNVAAKDNPVLAARQLWSDPSAMLRAVDLGQLVHGSAEEQASSATAAKRALTTQAISPTALSVLGTLADSQGRRPEAVKLFGDAHALTRRQLTVESWLLEYHVQKSRVPEVLAQYDIILRQSSDFQRIAFPILDAALADPEIRQAFRPYVSAETPWMREFLGITAATSPTPSVLAQMLLDTGLVGKALELQLDLPTLFRRLMETRHVEMIQPFYLAAKRGPASLLGSVELGEAVADQRIVPVAWRLAQDSEVSAEMLLTVEGRSGINVKTSTPDVRTVADKLAFVVPGRYRFSFAVDRVSGTVGDARWRVVCLGSGEPRLTASSENVLAENGARSLDFDVGPNCRAVQLILEVAGGRDEESIEVNFSKFGLTATG